MDANFFYYSIYDRFVQRQPHACMRPYPFSFKNFSETIDWIFTKFHRNFLKIEVENFSSMLQKKKKAFGAI